MTDYTFGCPKCGWDKFDYDNKKIFLGSFDYHAVVNAEGWDRYDWIETWKCPKCKTIFEIDNSNC